MKINRNHILIIAALAIAFYFYNKNKQPSFSAASTVDKKKMTDTYNWLMSCYKKLFVNGDTTVNPTSVMRNMTGMISRNEAANIGCEWAWDIVLKAINNRSSYKDQVIADIKYLANNPNQLF